MLHLTLHITIPANANHLFEKVVTLDENGGGSSNNATSGGPALPIKKDYFKSVDEFLNDTDYKEYDRISFYKIPTGHSKDQAINKMMKESKSDYHMLSANCGVAVCNTFEMIGLDTRSWVRVGKKGAKGYLTHWHSSSSLPNEQYQDIYKNNKSNFVKEYFKWGSSIYSW